MRLHARECDCDAGRRHVASRLITFSITANRPVAQCDRLRDSVGKARGLVAKAIQKGRDPKLEQRRVERRTKRLESAVLVVA